MKYVFLLRGINVGGNHKIKMADLKKIMSSLGAENILTYIQSGNVIAEIATDVVNFVNDVKEQIGLQCGFEPEIIHFEYEQFCSNVNAIDIEIDDPAKTYIYFYAALNPEINQLDIIALKADDEICKFYEFAFAISARSGIHNSKIGKKIDKLIPFAKSARNIKTCNKIVELGQ